MAPFNAGLVIISIFNVSCSPTYTASFQNNSPVQFTALRSDVAAYDYDSRLQSDMLASDQLTPKNPITSTLLIPTSAGTSEIKKTSKDVSNKARKASMIASLFNKPHDGNPKKNWAALTGFLLGVSGILVSFFLGPLAHISISFMAIVFIVALIISLIGLKSERRRLAFLGIIISLLTLVAFAILFNGVAA
ncbi:MAG: hypothetical protein JNJ65_13545 [Cyclobacteriaceae bacterium]|nr:hypothetical protein [Cyclobacteriaceae bacterium]